MSNLLHGFISVSSETTPGAPAIFYKDLTNNGNTIDKDQLLTAYKQQMPTFWVLAGIISTDKLPRNPNGKIDRRATATA